MINSLLFFIFSILMIISAIFCITTKNIIHSLLFSIIVFTSNGILFSILGATYNAVIQFLIFSITIPVLTGLCIMLNDKKQVTKIFNKQYFWTFLGILCFTIIFCEFLNLNDEIFNIIRACKTDINQYSELYSISHNIFYVYFMPFIEIIIGIFAVIAGIKHYGK